MRSKLLHVGALLLSYAAGGTQTSAPPRLLDFSTLRPGSTATRTCETFLESMHPADYDTSDDASADASSQHVTQTDAQHTRTLADKLFDLPTPADFLTPGQTTAQLIGGLIDAAPAIQAALATRRGVFLPCGYYLLGSPIVTTTSGTGIVGAGNRCVTLAVAYPTGDAIKIGDGTATPLNVSMSGFMLYAVNPRTSGSAIRIQHANNVSLKDFTISGQFYSGVEVDGASGGAGGFGIRMDNFEIQSATGSACLLVKSFMQDVYLSNGLLGTIPIALGCRHAGLEIQDAGGVYATNLDVIGAGTNGLLIDPSAASTQSVFAVFLTNFLSDTSHADNIVLGGSGPITEINFNNVWASSSVTGRGLLASNPRLDGLTATNTTLIGNWQDGALITAGRNINFTAGLRAIENNMNPSGSFSGVSITAGVDQVTINSAKLGGGGVFGATIRNGAPAAPVANRQAYGAIIASGVTNLIFTGNQAGGNVTAGCSLPVASATVIRVNNIGSGC
jgi:hypothetical protein